MSPPVFLLLLSFGPLHADVITAPTPSTPSGLTDDPAPPAVPPHPESERQRYGLTIGSLCLAAGALLWLGRRRPDAPA